MDLEKEISKLIQRIKHLEGRVKELELENADLKEKLHKKNSNNSSIPPSKDENRVKPKQSLRRSKGRKSGGQQGHKGHHLEMTERPDKTVVYKPEYCNCCGKKLIDEARLVGKRQVIDIPPINPIITEHQVYSVTCQCNHVNQGDFPDHVKGSISYGMRIESLIAYLSVRQYISIQRIQEYLKQVCGISMSQGTIVNKIEEFATKCQPIYESIRQRIQNSTVIGSDETGCVVNGEKHWMWTWQNKKLTFISASTSRGYAAIKDNFENGFQNSILISDCWAAQLKTRTKTKQICTAHLQRELNYFIEHSEDVWSESFLQLIYKGLTLKNKILAQPKESFEEQIQQIKSASQKLLDEQIIGSKKLKALKKRLRKNEKYLWTFLDYPEVPPDNNASERAIRNVKVKQKISGQFKSSRGAAQFAIIRSVIDTILKNGSNVFDTLLLIPNFDPE